jgi:phosphonate transport system substrate-binding protein
MAGLMRFVSLALALVLGPSALAGEKSPLTLGVFPYVTPVQLAAFHAPLKDYLAKNLGRPVTLVTAPDFNSFVDRTREGQYDIVFTAPHLGRLAETRDGYKRMAQTSHTVQGFFLAPKNSNIHTIKDLKGKTVMIAQKVSIVYQMAEHTLRENGLMPGESVTIVETRTHNNAIQAPLRGEADASVTGKLLWHVLDDAQKAQLQVIGTTEEAPGFLVMAHPRLAKQDIEKIQKLLLDFHRVPGSESYFTTNGYEKFQAVDDRAMKGLDPYTQIFLKPAGP